MATIISKRVIAHPAHVNHFITAVEFGEAKDIKSLRCANRVLALLKGGMKRLDANYKKTVYVDPEVATPEEFAEAQAAEKVPTGAVYDPALAVEVVLPTEEYDYLKDAINSFLPKVNPAMVTKATLLALVVAVEKAQPATTEE